MSDLIGGMAFALCVGLWLGFWWRGRQEKPPTLLQRLTEGDVRLFFVKLRPFLRHPDWPTDAAITLYNDGHVHVDAHLIGGSRVQGQGDSLDAASAAIRKSAGIIDRAIP